MGRFWGHAVRPMTPDEYASSDPWSQELPSWLPVGEVSRWNHAVSKRAEEQRQCRSNRKCCTPTEYVVVTYSYVSGRAGRTSWAENQVCREHARRFAHRYGIEMPEAA